MRDLSFDRFSNSPAPVDGRGVMSFRNSKYFAHAVVLCTVPFIVLVGVISNSAYVGGFLGGAAGAFTWRDPLAILLCGGLGIAWRRSKQSLVWALLAANIAYRLGMSAYNISHYKDMLDASIFEPRLLPIIASSYGAVVLGYLSNLAAALITDKRKNKNMEPQI